MPEKIIQRKCFVINTAYKIVKRKTGTKKERIINNRTIPILSAAVLYPYLWYSRSYKFVWRFISKFPRLL